MKSILSEKEIKNRLKTIEIICDTREQENSHITGYLDTKGIARVSRSLSVGDYSFQIGDKSFEDEITIERKGSLTELSGNLSNDRLRFENEFLRAKANNVKVFLVIENGSWAKINAHEYRSQMKPKALVASLLAFQVRYNITVMFCEPHDTAELIYGTLFYWCKERLQ
jgi:ERCC4-type nuclease